MDRTLRDHGLVLSDRQNLSAIGLGRAGLIRTRPFLLRTSRTNKKQRHQRDQHNEISEREDPARRPRNPDRQRFHLAHYQVVDGDDLDYRKEGENKAGEEHCVEKRNLTHPRKIPRDGELERDHREHCGICQSNSLVLSQKTVHRTITIRSIGRNTFQT